MMVIGNNKDAQSDVKAIEGFRSGDDVEITIKGRYVFSDGHGSPSRHFITIGEDGDTNDIVYFQIPENVIRNPSVEIKLIDSPLRVGDLVTANGFEWQVAARPRLTESGGVEVSLWRDDLGYSYAPSSSVERIS